MKTAAVHLSLELLRLCRVTFRSIHEFRVNLKSPSQQPVRQAYVLFFALIPGQFTFVDICYLYLKRRTTFNKHSSSNMAATSSLATVQSKKPSVRIPIWNPDLRAMKMSFEVILMRCWWETHISVGTLFHTTPGCSPLSQCPSVHFCFTIIRPQSFQDYPARWETE